jgi:hypothetical protein
MHELVTSVGNLSGYYARLNQEIWVKYESPEPYYYLEEHL